MTEQNTPSGLGLRRGTVAVEPHKAEWETIARQTIARLRGILQNAVIDAQHIGSTAVRGICAKPIIDIVVGVSDFDEILALNDVLEENGFIFRGQDHPGQYLYVCGEGDFRTHHIHVVIHDSQAWKDYVDMRDYLNCRRDDAQAYSELKACLAKRYPKDRKTYTAMKGEMIREILTKAHRWRQSRN